MFKFIKQLFCKHKNIDQSWFVQGIMWRNCTDCGANEIEGILNVSAGKLPFTKLVNKEHNNYRTKNK